MNKKLRVFIFLLLGVWSSSLMAYIPTLDSLLRNGGNIDIGESTVVGSILVSKVPGESSEDVSIQPQRTAHKLLFTGESSNLWSLLQLDYRNGLFSSATINRIKVVKKLKSKSFSAELIETKLIYGLFKSLFLNESDLLVSVLNSIDPEILPNRELLDKEQLILLNKYKKYLTNLSEGVEDLPSPFLNEDIEKQKEINEILNKNLIASNNKVKRIFKNKKFFLTYISDTIELVFENETHQLISIKVKSGESDIKFEMLNHVLYSGGFEFPEEISIKLANGDRYQLTLKKLQLIKDSPQSYARRVKAYKEQVKEVEDKVIVLNKPMFML